jgi:lipopolysaccharide biosynthesis glycosyltransferase
MDFVPFTALLNTTFEMKKYTLIFVADQNYFHYSLVNLISLQQQGYENIFVILDNKDTQEKFKVLNKHLKLNCKSIVFDVNAVIDGNKKDAMENHVTPFSYVSCKIPELFSSYKYAVLLPVDSVIDNLSELKITSDFDEPLAAVPDLESTQIHIKGVADGSYFNAGVLIFNIEKWNKLSLNKVVMEFLQNGKTYEFQDQDILNETVNGFFHKLPEYLNAIPESLLKDQGELIHFAGSSKPWMPESKRIGTERWRQNCLVAILKIENLKNRIRFKVEIQSESQIKNLIKSIIRFFLKERYRIESQFLLSEIGIALNKLKGFQS